MTKLFIALALGLFANRLSAVDDGTTSLWSDDLRVARQLLERRSLPEIDGILKEGTNADRTALRAAFGKLPPDKFKAEVLLRFLEEPDEFWDSQPFGKAALEVEVVDAMTRRAIGFLLAEYQVDLVASELFSTSNGRAEIGRMIRAKIGEREKLPPKAQPKAPVNAIVPESPGAASGLPSSSVQPNAAETKTASPPWLLIAIGALVAVGIVALLIRNLRSVR